MYYILRVCDYYLEDFEINKEGVLNNIKFSYDCKYLFATRELAKEIANRLFIELGVKLTINEFEIGKEER